MSLGELFLALCSEISDGVWGGFGSALPPLVDGKAPEWVEIVPGTKTINAVDGRVFRNLTPEAIVARFDADPNDAPFDWEHSTEILARKGKRAPASGWIKELSVRKGGSVWARVEWTDDGADDLVKKRYKYSSPGFLHTKDGNIVAITSAGLTNTPAFRMTALAQAEPAPEKPKMNKVLRLLLAKLGLASTVTDEDVIIAAMAAAEAKIASDLQAAVASAQPTLDKFVPIETYKLATARVSELETAAAASAKSTLDSEITAVLEAASKEGKIAPPEFDFFRASASVEGGLERLKTFVASAAVKVAPGEDPAVPKTPKKGKTEDTHGLNAEQLSIASDCGLTPEQYANAAVTA